MFFRLRLQLLNLFHFSGLLKWNKRERRLIGRAGSH